MNHMCSERDCQIFRGRITACDMCAKNHSGMAPGRMPVGDAPRPPASPI